MQQVAAGSAPVDFPMQVAPQMDVLYDRGPCLVVNKPPGLLTQGPAGIDSLEVRVKEVYRQREHKEGNIYLGVPHRLYPTDHAGEEPPRHSPGAPLCSPQIADHPLSS